MTRDDVWESRANLIVAAITLLIMMIFFAGFVVGQIIGRFTDRTIKIEIVREGEGKTP